MQNARLDEAQTEIKISRGNINNLRYADDTTLVAEFGARPIEGGSKMKGRGLVLEEPTGHGKL